MPASAHTVFYKLPIIKAESLYFGIIYMYALFDQTKLRGTELKQKHSWNETTRNITERY